jgi:O-antigen ligase
MNRSDFGCIAKAVAILNMAALAVALAEVYFGLQHFYAATNPVNLIVFRSQDVVYGGVAYYRIPATFVSSASYASNMVASLPILVGALAQEGNRSRWRYVLIVAIGCTALAVFLAASRSAVVPLLIIGVAATLPGTLRNVSRRTWAALILSVAIVVAVTPRMQRFVTLQDTDYVIGRIYGSINQNLVTLATEYPLGNGLGGGGTSVPYFLEDRVINPVVLENEYARIMAEQGIPGLLLWCAFLIWLFRRPAGSRSDPSYKGRSLAWLFCLISFATAPLGLGMLDAVPSTETLLMLMGWFAAPEPTSGARTGESHSWLGRGLYTRGVSRQSREHALAQLFSVYCSATANGNQKY